MNNVSCGTVSFLHVLNIINLSFDTYDIGLRGPSSNPKHSGLVKLDDGFK